MLTYDLTQRGNLSRYEYLYRCIKEDILSGRLQAGERLPSKRALAGHLEIAVVTVETAYAQLAAEGYLRPEAKRGFFVSQVETQEMPEKSEWESEEEPELRSLDFNAGGTSEDSFPFSVWAKLTRRVLSDKGKELMAPMPHNGVKELRQAIARHLYRNRGIRVRADQIVIGAGTEYLYNLIVQLLGREKIYAVEDPGYYKAARIYRLNGANCISVPVDRQGANPETVELSDIQILHLSPNHQFPTGTVMPIARRQQFLRWAAQDPQRCIIEDDYDSEFRFTGLPIPAMKEIDQEESVIYMNTFSRSLAPSLRISYMVLPRRMLECYQQRLGFYSCTVPAIEQYTLAQFLDGGYFESHVNRVRNLYRGQRDRMIDVIRSSPMADFCRIEGENAGLHFLLRIDAPISEEQLAKQADVSGLQCSLMRDYQSKETTEWTRTLVIPYPVLDPTGLKDYLECLKAHIYAEN